MQKPQHTQPVSEPPLFTVELTFPVHDFQSDWKQCSLLANYIAEYTAYQFEQQERAENIISTITNELLEAIVYLAPAQSDLVIGVKHHETGLQLNTSHLIHAELIDAYTTFLADLKPGSTNEPYLNLLTSADTPRHYFNQLGLMMLSCDFGVHMMRVPMLQTERICTQLFIANEEFYA
jgi:hypothetical protein